METLKVFVIAGTCIIFGSMLKEAVCSLIDTIKEHFNAKNKSR